MRKIHNTASLSDAARYEKNDIFGFNPTCLFALSVSRHLRWAEYSRLPED